MLDFVNCAYYMEATLTASAVAIGNPAAIGAVKVFASPDFSDTQRSIHLQAVALWLLAALLAAVGLLIAGQLLARLAVSEARAHGGLRALGMTRQHCWPRGWGGRRLLEPTTPADVVNFGQVQNLPLVLGGCFGVLALLTIAHLLVASVRRRRRDIAVLQAVGFSRRQVRAAVACQSATLMAVSLAVGIPVGMICGRQIWLLLTRRWRCARSELD